MSVHLWLPQQIQTCNQVIIKFISNPPHQATRAFACFLMLQNLDREFKVFMPVSTFLIFWHYMMILIMILDFYFSVLFICFDSSFSGNLIKFFTLPLLLIICASDVIITLNTSIIHKGQIITNTLTIRRKYLRSLYFAFDMVALLVIILQLIFLHVFNKTESLLNLLIRSDEQETFLNFLIFLKVFKINKFDKLTEKYVMRSKGWQLMYKISKHVLLLILVCHFIGSFFYYLDTWIDALNWYPRDQLWIYNSYAYQNIASLPTIWKYCYSFYYAIITMSGCAYGDLVPLNPTEVAYTCFSLALPMIVYAYMFSVVYRAIGELQLKEIKTKKYKKIIKNYFQDSCIDANIKSRFIYYLTYAYEKKSVINNQYFQEIAPKLKSNFIRHVLDNQFDFTIFAELGTASSSLLDIKKIAYECAEEEPFPSKYVFNVLKRKEKKLYYIISGEVSEYLLIRQRKHGKVLPKKTFFGQYTFFTGVTHAHVNHLFEANDFTVCHTIDCGRFKELMKESTPILETYFSLRNKVLFENHLKRIKTQCFFCDSEEHVVDRCPRLRLTVDAVQVSQRQNRRCSDYRRRSDLARKYCNLLKPPKLQIVEEDKTMENKYTEKEVQTHTEPVQQVSDNYHCRYRFAEKVENWKIFCSKYSFQ